MKKLFLVFAIAAALALPASAIFSQQIETPATGERQGMGAGMQGGGMMCPMTGTEEGMGMMGGMGGDPKTMGRMMEMRGEMMKAMGEIMMKHGAELEQQK